MFVCRFQSRRNGRHRFVQTPLYRDVFASSAAAALSNTLCRLASVVGGSAFKEAASNTAQVAAASLPALAVNRRGLSQQEINITRKGPGVDDEPDAVRFLEGARLEVVRDLSQR